MSEEAKRHMLAMMESMERANNALKNLPAVDRFIPPEFLFPPVTEEEMAYVYKSLGVSDG